jgi:hypothetical protein
MIEVVRVAVGSARYDEVLAQLRAPDLRDRMWCDGEHRLEEHPGKTWWVVLADGRPAAWCAARVDGVLRCSDNFEAPGAGRQLGLYRLAFLARHHDMVARARQPAVTYLFTGQVVDLHEAFGWHRTGATGLGELPGHTWWELQRQSR